MKKINLLAVVVAGAFAVACNGGSSSGGSSAPTPTPTPTITPTPSPITPTSCLSADGCNYVQANGQWESVATTSLSVTGAGQSISFTSGESFITIAMPVLNSSNKSLNTTTTVSSRPVNDVCNPPNQNHNFVIVNGTCQLLPDGQNYAVVTIPGDAYLRGNYSVYTSINGSWSSFNSYTNPNWTILPNNATPPINLTTESAMYYDGSNSFYNTSLINSESTSITPLAPFAHEISMPYAGLHTFKAYYYNNNMQLTGSSLYMSNGQSFCSEMIWCGQFPDSGSVGGLSIGVSMVNYNDSTVLGSDGYLYANCAPEGQDVVWAKLTKLGNGISAIANRVNKDYITTSSASYWSTEIITLTKSNNAILQVTGTFSSAESRISLCNLYQ